MSYKRTADKSVNKISSKFYTQEEVCRMLHCTRQNLYHHRHRVINEYGNDLLDDRFLRYSQNELYYHELLVFLIATRVDNEFSTYFKKQYIGKLTKFFGES